MNIKTNEEKSVYIRSNLVRLINEIRRKRNLTKDEHVVIARSDAMALTLILNRYKKHAPLNPDECE